MDSTSINQFKTNLQTFVEQVISTHEPLKVTCQTGEDFVVISANDWEREQETLYVLQNNDLMQQIVNSLHTHQHSQGYSPTEVELNEITSI